MKTGNVMKYGRWVGVLCLGCFVAGSTRAQETPPPDIMGAQKVLEVIVKASAETNTVTASDAESPERVQYKLDLDRFKAARLGMEPEQAAGEWLSLFDRFWKLPIDSTPRHNPYDDYENQSKALSFSTVLTALPEPSAWDALSGAVEKRAPKTTPEEQRFEASLRMLTDFLTGSDEKFDKDMTAFESQLSGLKGYDLQRAQESLRDLRVSYEAVRQSDTSEGVLRKLEKVLEVQKKGKDEKITLKIPDLVTLVGEARAEKLIGTALETPGVSIDIQYGETTMALARKLCLDRMDSLLQPQWALVNSPDTVALYEGLAKKFPSSPSDAKEALKSEFVERNYYDGFNDFGSRNSAERDAKSYYIIGLLVQNRVQDALAFVAGLKETDKGSVLYALVRNWDSAVIAVPSAVLFDFSERILKTDDNNAFWSRYISLAVQLGKTREMIEFLSAEAARTDLSFDRHLEAYEQLFSGYLAADLVDDSVRVMRLILQMDVAKNTPAEQFTFEGKRMEVSLGLARLGRLLDKPEWLSEGLQGFESAVEKARAMPPQNSNYSLGSRINDYIELLLDCHQYAKAESCLVDTIAAKFKNSKSRPAYESDSESLQSELQQLIEVYYRAGRYGDILEVLEKAPWWGASDLMQMDDNRYGNGASLGVMAAEGLRSAGRTAEAITILKMGLYLSPGEDDAYALLIKLSQDDLIPWLNSLYVLDRFEERPLIWKAHLLMKAGKLDVAEKTILEALRVDPTDGETRAGNRVRAYTVMSEIKAAKGLKDDAKFFADVVKAVNIAEHGDELNSAGLISRSIVEYEKAQGYFGDAYCVQWRLAKRFDELGQTEEAEKHYRIAFERMPEQFGQVASFCFGCEGAFDSKHSQSAAEKVLRGLEKSGPARPQVYYLLGQLREAQNRFPEAYAYYVKAVEMDPDYLDAWGELRSIAERIFLPQAERDRINFELLRIDPRGLHTRVDLEAIGNLRKLWEVLAATPKLEVTIPKSLLPLVASEAWMKEQTKKEQGWRENYRSFMGYSRSSKLKTREPSEAITQNKIVQQIVQLMGSRMTSSDSWSEFDFED